MILWGLVFFKSLYAKKKILEKILHYYEKYLTDQFISKLIKPSQIWGKKSDKLLSA